MNIYVPLGLFLTLLCGFFSNGQRKEIRVFTFCMVVAFVFSAIRYEFGPDYFSYLEIFEHGDSGRSLSSYMSERESVRLEPVFRFYIQLFPKYTFFIITNTLLWFISVYLLFRKYVDLKYGWVLILFLFFNINCMINNYVAMRTSLAAVCFIPAFYFLSHHKKWLFVLFVILGGLFHNSTIALLLLVFLTEKKSILFYRFFVIITGIIALVILLVGENFITVTLSGMVMDSVEDMSRYSGYLERVSSAKFTINSLIFKVLTFIPALYLIDAANKDPNKEYMYIYKTGIITALLVLLLGQNILTDRFVMILNPIFIIAIVRAFHYMRKEYNIAAIFSIFIVSFYMFYNMMNSSYAVSYQTYHTIFSAPYIP